VTRKVLVTGGTGCLGSNLVRHLLGLDRWQVTLLKRAGDPLGPLADVAPDIEVRHGDVRDLGAVRRAVRGVDAVFHLAGIAAPLNRLAELMWEVNVGGTYNVALAARDAGVARVVHVSSVAAIGFPPDGTVASEAFDFGDSVCRNAYAVTKYWGERVALGFNDASFEVIAVNPSAVIAAGGDRRFGWAAVVDAARRGWLRCYGGGGSAFCTRRDLVYGLVAAMEIGRPGERYIVSSANRTYAEFGAAIAAAVGVAAPWFRCPRAVLNAVGRCNDWRSAFISDPQRLPVLVSENTDLMSRSIFYDQSKAIGQLGLTQSPLADAIAEMAAWCASGALPPIERDAVPHGAWPPSALA
jgi:dihydroflavonol-4-reductase